MTATEAVDRALARVDQIYADQMRALQTRLLTQADGCDPDDLEQLVGLSREEYATWRETMRTELLVALRREGREADDGDR